MSRTIPFDEYSKEYDNWYNENQNIYTAELNALKEFIPSGLKGVEIGIGTGRFAFPLGIRTGVEPSRSMAEMSRRLDIEVLEGVAEKLPLDDGTFDYALMVTAICFFDDVQKAFSEAYRILKNNGFLVVAFIDRESGLGKLYGKYKQENKFYRDAVFYSVEEVSDFLKNTGFTGFEYRQTVFSKENIVYNVEPGFGKGGFVVVKAEKQGGS